jgi:hypothetical protein
MAGLIGAMLHPAPKNALVIGLGTGSTAGWLGAVPNIESVDVVELEPAIERVARDCHAVNREALDNPKIRLAFGDAREVLLTTPRRYDLVFSEPSNPYRAGISSLFTEEFYAAVRARLGPGGILVQWLQAYEIDSASVSRVYATLASVFPHVETWRSKGTDLLLVASAGPPVRDVGVLRARAREEPYRSAMLAAWRVDDLEGFFAHFVARASFSRALAGTIPPAERNTDDRNLLELALARSVGRPLFQLSDLRRLARARREDRPELDGGALDHELVDDWRAELPTLYGLRPEPALAEDAPSPSQLARRQLVALWQAGALDEVRAEWRARPIEPRTALEVTALAEALAVRGDDDAAPFIERVSALSAVDAAALRARLRHARGDLAGAVTELELAMGGAERDPFATQALLLRALSLSPAIARLDAALGRRLFERLGAPFAAEVLRAARLELRFEVANALGSPDLCVAALAPFEPFAPFRRDFLERRALCYERAGSPLLVRAADDLAALSSLDPAGFGRELGGH